MKRFASVAALVAVAVAAPAARGQDIGGTMPTPEFGENAPENYESSQRFALEIKFGPYSPNIDASPGLNGHKPFSDLFSNGTKRPAGRLLTQVEFDYQFMHRAWGSLAIGNTVGFYRRTSHSFAYTTDPTTGTMTAPCSVAAGTCVRSGDQTALNVIPLSLLAVYRFDYLARRWRIPFVPYFKIGLAYYAWWIENGGGFLSVSQFQNGTQKDSGFGGTWGWVMNPGGAFLLDVLDPTAARVVDAELGINHTYLFVEFHYADVTGFGASNKMDLSDTTLNAGLSFEF